LHVVAVGSVNWSWWRGLTLSGAPTADTTAPSAGFTGTWSGMKAEKHKTWRSDYQEQKERQAQRLDWRTF